MKAKIRAIAEWPVIIIFYATLSVLYKNQTHNEVPFWIDAIFHIANGIRLLSSFV